MASVTIRDVNADGLGDRWGVALEQVPQPSHWVVYLDGRPVYRGPDEAHARAAARWVESWGGLASKERRHG